MSMTAEALKADQLAKRRAGEASRLVDGVTFALDQTLEQLAIWGHGEEVAWPPGEPVIFVGPDGVGKTTVLQRLALCRIGVGSELLGYPVRRAETKVLYAAADRPKQGARSLRRMVLALRDEEMERVRASLVVWKGPLPFDLVHEPGRLASWASEHGASDVFLDSLGLIVPALTKDEVGAAIAQAFSTCSSEGLEVVSNYHPRKASNENRKPNKLEDVYGSRWITSACGSVLSLWGQAGDPVVELRHLKQPGEPIGPFMVEIDHLTGTVTMAEGTDLLAILRAAANGLTAQEASAYLDGATDEARTRKARRKLETLRERGLAHRREGMAMRGPVREPDRYYATMRTSHADTLL